MKRVVLILAVSLSGVQLSDASSLQFPNRLNVNFSNDFRVVTKSTSYVTLANPKNYPNLNDLIQPFGLPFDEGNLEIAARPFLFFINKKRTYKYRPKGIKPIPMRVKVPP